MIVALIAALLVACGFLFKKANSANTENAQLKGQVASLKRQLARQRT
jgi:hypothetical protein